ncbi:hypothetical protein [Thermomonospora amylolytica]|uniref:hypothetical protein n=1 Tax=Thermomonospora amylolytica TaxID=1411117 RepID=UPI000E6D2AA7|nr:hypothetical protein [Thermomonospora amylolytica]
MINGLFEWLVERGDRRRRPLRLPRRYGSGLSRQMQVRHLTLEQYLFFRDVGLGGQRPDGEVDLAFRGWCPHRNRAAVELALMTGMRKREWSSVLLPELATGDRRPGDPVRFWLQACAKYGRQREVYVPVAALDLIGTYVLLERRELAARSAGRLARRRRELFVVDDIDRNRGRLGGVWQGRRRVFRIERMPEPLRRITVPPSSAPPSGPRRVPGRAARVRSWCSCCSSPSGCTAAGRAGDGGSFGPVPPSRVDGRGERPGWRRGRAQRAAVAPVSK